MKRLPGGRHRQVLVGLAASGLIAAAAAAGAPASAQPGAAVPDTLFLTNVLDLAASGSRSAAAAATDLEIAESAVRRARAGWWPRIDLDARYTVRDNPIEAEAGGFRIPTAQKANGEYSLSARELLYDGGRRGLAVAAAERQVAAAREAGVADVRDAQLQALDSYLAALELTGRRRVLDQRLTALGDHRRTAGDLYEHGLIARNDLLETEVRVRAVTDQRQTVVNRWQVAVQNLNRQIGRAPDTPTALPDSLPPPPPLNDARDALVTSAGQDNAAARAAAERLRVAEAARDLAGKLWVPSVFVGATHAFQENEHLVHEFINSLSAGVSWNVFDGGARTADAQQAAARVVAAERDRIEVARAVAIAADAAWLAWDQAGREERTAEANVAAAGENLRIVEDQYRGGLARSSDVLDAEALLAEARFDVLARHYAAYRAQAELLVSAGIDLADFYRGAAAQEN